MAFDSSKRYHVTALACAVASALSLNASVVQAQEEAEIKEEDVEIDESEEIKEDIKEEPQKYKLNLNVKDIPTELDEFSKYFTLCSLVYFVFK